MAHQVFICYASEDREVADRVCSELEGEGVRCWMAPRDLTPSMDYAEAIIEAFSASRLVVLIFSQHSNRSPHVRREVERAASRGIPIVPFRIDDVALSPSLEYFIASTQWLDALEQPLAPHLARLARTVRSLLHLEDAPVEDGERAVCRHCGSPLRVGARFCRTCGGAVAPETGEMEPGGADVELKSPHKQEQAAQSVPVAVIDRVKAAEGADGEQLKRVEMAMPEVPPTPDISEAVQPYEAAVAADPARRTMSALADALIAGWGTVLLTFLLGVPGLTASIGLSMAYLWVGSVQGRTLGKVLFKLATVHDVPGSPGGPIRASEAAAMRPGLAVGSLRALVIVLGMLPLGLGFWQMFLRADRRTWHDTVTQTVVVDTL